MTRKNCKLDMILNLKTQDDRTIYYNNLKYIKHACINIATKNTKKQIYIYIYIYMENNDTEVMKSIN